MPIGRVRWYDPEKGYGFVSNPGDEDCYVGKNVLPAGVDKLEKVSESSLILRTWGRNLRHCA